MKKKYYVVAFSHDGFLPISVGSIEKYDHETKEEAEEVIRKLLEINDWHKRFTIIEGYTK